MIHHLYFDDNDSFFPPSYLGKEDSQRRSSNASSSHASDKETNMAENTERSSE